MKLNELLDVKLLDQHRMNRLVGCQIHPVLPLRIYNYTSAAQFDPHWGDGTIDYCRGLIVDNEDNIVARPFKKFHNLNTESILETMEANLPDCEPLVTQKYDGSLGIYWQYEGQEGIATRGSFTSPQAVWATNWYHCRRQHGLFKNGNTDWLENVTPLFEIIYNENRIVVSYSFEGLVLIGAVGKQSGMEISHNGLQQVGQENDLRVAWRLDGSLGLEGLKQANDPNEEGYVLTYPRLNQDSLKVKIKMADYVRLHRIITGMNPRSVWDMLNTGSYDPMKFEDCPKEFKIWLDLWVKKLYDEFRKLKSIGEEMFANRPIQTNPDKRVYRAECAAYFKVQNQPSLSGVFFGMLDDKDVDPILWDMIEPRGNDMTFRKDGE